MSPVCNCRRHFCIVAGAYPAGRIVLVGDPCQLPPTVLSRAAEAAMLTQSLFERLARAGWPVTMLREQYRMHPLISAFPSR
jgi:senataxin